MMMHHFHFRLEGSHRNNTKNKHPKNQYVEKINLDFKHKDKTDKQEVFA